LSDTITEEQEKNVGVNLHKFVDVSSLQPTLREEEFWWINQSAKFDVMETRQKRIKRPTL